MEETSEQWFTEVEVNIVGFSPTLRWMITLAYTNQWISEIKNYSLCIFVPYFEIYKKNSEVDNCFMLALQFLLFLWNLHVE